MLSFVDIRSKENSNFRRAKELKQPKVAREEGLVFLEGIRLCADALLSRLCPQEIFFTKDLESTINQWDQTYNFPDSVKLYRLSDALFSRLCDTKNPQGVAMLVPSPVLSSQIPQKGEDIYLVCEGISDPGNLGTMIRLADAFAFTAVLLVSGCVDPFNSKVLRSAMGSCFHIPIVQFESINSLLESLKEAKIALITADLKGTPLWEAALTLPIAIMIGNEAHGISETSRGAATEIVTIPMEGQAESLNASSAAAILAYELRRRGR